MSDESQPPSRKRKRCAEAHLATPPSSSPPKRQKQSEQQRYRTPARFFDNLSRLYLVPRALRELDRRTKPVLPPARPVYTEVKAEDIIRLKQFARHGGPGLCDLKSYPEPDGTRLAARMNSSESSNRRSHSQARQSSATSTTTRTRKSSAYDPNFEGHMTDHGYYPEGYDDKEPNNLESIRERLARPRASLSPSRLPLESFLGFRKANREAMTEQDVMQKPFPIIIGDKDIPSAFGVGFNNLANLTDGTTNEPIVDFYDGCRPRDIDPRVRKELGSWIEPSTNKSRPCLPNCFVEGKGPTGSAAVAGNQALQDGAFGARAMHTMREYIDPNTALDGNAYAITATYSGGASNDSLKLYTTHPTKSVIPGKTVEYRMTQIGSYAMTHNPKTFCEGAAALRNAREWAQEKRRGLIAAANEKVNNTDLSNPTTSAISGASHATETPEHNSDTSLDELAAESTVLNGFSSSTSVGGRRGRTSQPSSKTRRSKKREYRSKSENPGKRQ